MGLLTDIVVKVHLKMSAFAVHLRPSSSSGAANAKVPGAAIVFIGCTQTSKH